MTHAALPVVSWDLDGTLYDLDALRADVRHRIARSVRPGSWRQARDAGRALRQHRNHVQRVRSAGGVLDAEAHAFWSGTLWADFTGHFVIPALRALGPWQGALTFLQQAADAGLTSVVVSDFAVEEKLDALGLSAFFQAGFAGSAIGALKPHPSVFAHVMERLKVVPSSLLHIGDRADTDGVAAASAGVRFCHVVRGDFVPVGVALDRWRNG